MMAGVSIVDSLAEKKLTGKLTKLINIKNDHLFKFMKEFLWFLSFYYIRNSIQVILL